MKFAKNLKVKVSPRGYVIVSIWGTDFEVTKFMDSGLKDQIQKMPYQDHFLPWQKEMKRLETEAVEEIRRIWKARKKQK